jgi:hypothetical protein
VQAPDVIPHLLQQFHLLGVGRVMGGLETPQTLVQGVGRHHGYAA